MNISKFLISPRFQNYQKLFATIYTRNVFQLFINIFLQTPNVKMTAVILNQPLNKINSLASKFAKSMIPFFFVKNNSEQMFSQHSNLTYKVNRQMTPFLRNLPQSARLAFWNASQFEASQIQNQTLKKSLILNPYKTQSLINSALNKGIRKMLVSDIQQVAKIQNCYFNLRKNGLSVEQPEYIWNVQNQTADAQNVIDLQQCDLPFHGLYFNREMTINQIQNFLEIQPLKNKVLQNYKETTLQTLQKQNIQLRSLGIEPLITNYSQTNNYLMVCRIIGKDKLGKPIFQNSCLDFICRADTCNCINPPTKINQIFSAGGFQWAVIQPARLDKLQVSHIQE